MGLTALKMGQGLQRPGGLGVQIGGGGQGDEHLVAVEPGVVGAQVLHLDSLDGLDGLPGDEVVLVINARQALEGVEQGGLVL